MVVFNGISLTMYTATPIRPGPPTPPLGSERCLELALARWFIYSRPPGEPVEVGAVTPYYWKSGHTVIDLTDPVPEAIHVDVCEVRDFKGKSVLSLSTFEHVGPRERSIETLLRITEEASSYLVTVPVGWNSKFDDLMRASPLLPLAQVFNRTGESEWEQTDEYAGTYGEPFPYANTIAVLLRERLHPAPLRQPAG